MSEDGSLHEISLAIGELRGEARGIRKLMVEHQEIADRAWQRLYSENRDVDMKVEEIAQQQVLAKQQITTIQEQISGDEGIKARLGALERTAHNAAAIFAGLSAIVTIIAFILAHYGVEIFKWIFGRQ